MAENSPPNSSPENAPSTQNVPPPEATPIQPVASTGDESPDLSAGGWSPESERASYENRLQATNVEADKILIANTLHFNSIVTESDEEVAIRAFSADYGAPISEQREKELNEIFVAGDDLTALLNDLLNRRFLILAGAPEIGKTMLALCLSFMVRQYVEAPCHETFLARPLQRRVKLELQKVAEDRKAFGQRVVIFPQIGESDNSDLQDLFARLKDFELDKIIAALEKTKSFFLFTIDAPNIKSWKEDLKRLGILHEVSQLSKNLLGHGLEKKVAQFLKKKGVPLESEKAEAARTLIKANKEMLLERLPKLSRLSLLIEDYLLSVIDGKLDLTEAIDLVESPEKWFLQDLSKDFDAWCFVFTLGLCQSGADIEGVPWMEFEIIRREIMKCLMRELRMWRQQPQEDTHFQRLLEEHALLEKCRAQISREAGVGDLVRFDDSSYGPKLWRVFTNSNRRILTLILPVLRELAQSNDTQIRARAARMLGRMGEINPALITLATIREWVGANSLRQKAAVGYLYEGAFASRDESYLTTCRTGLENLSLSKDADELWTAITVYKQIGQGGGDHLVQAVAKLGEITERNFARWLGLEKKIEQQLQSYEQRKQKNLQELLVTAANIQTLEDLRKILRQVYHKDGRIMLAICYSLVALSMRVGVVEVIVELNKWLQQGHKGLADLTSLIFWMDDGIADRLARYKIPVTNFTAVGGEAHYCLYFVVALGDAAQTDSQAISQTARFLADTYYQFSEFFPMRMKQLLRNQFLSHLKSWARSAWVVKEYRYALKDLYVELLKGRHAELVESLTDYLRNDTEFTTKAHLKRFAEMVLTDR